MCMSRRVANLRGGWRAYASYKRSNTYMKGGAIEMLHPEEHIPVPRPTVALDARLIEERQIRRLENKARADEQQLSINIKMLEAYMRQRAAIVKHFENASIADLFVLTDDTQRLQELHRVLGTTESAEQRFLSAISKSMRLLASSFVNTFLVDLNASFQLTGNTPDGLEPSSFLFRKDLFNSIKDNPKRLELIRILSQIYLGDEKHPNFSQFMAHLDRAEIARICDSMATTNAFTSLESYRYNFLHHKSGQSLNYDHSDTLRGVQSWAIPRFSSAKNDSFLYIQGLSRCFQKFKGSQASHSDRLELILSIAKVLLPKKGPAPTYSIFRYLLTEFGKANLLNYQSMVLNVLPGYEYQQTVLGSSKGSIISPKAAEQLIECIEDDPDILGALAGSCSHQGPNMPLEQVLSFYRLNEVIQHERVLNTSNLARLVSKSRFTRNRDINLQSVVFDTDMPIIASVEVIYSAIESCINLKRFHYIDALFNKLIVHSVERNDEIKLALSFGNTNDVSRGDFSLLLAQNLTFAEMADKLFTRELLVLLLRASRLSDDVGRMMWLTPHLDAYINKHLDSSRAHVEEIKTLALSLDAVPAHFWLNDSEMPINTNLIFEIDQALSVLGLHGKKHTYDKFLDFESVASLANLQPTGR